MNAMGHDVRTYIGVDQREIGRWISRLIDGGYMPMGSAGTKAGTFELACLIPGHYESGMKGVVVVSNWDADREIVCHSAYSLEDTNDAQVSGHAGSSPERCRPVSDGRKTMVMPSSMSSFHGRCLMVILPAGSSSGQFTVMKIEKPKK